MKILAIGDIHCKQWIIDSVEDLIYYYDHIVFVGDYVDNWGATAEDNMNAWARIKELVDSNKKKVTALFGNHDYAYLHKEVAGKSTGFDPATFAQIHSPNNAKLKKWLLSLAPVVEIDGVTFSHAGVANGWSFTEGEMWSNHSPIWLRPETVVYKYTPQVFGHTASQKIWQPQKDAWCIDTFSQYKDGTPYGDQTVLEIIDGKKFNVRKLNEHS